MLWILGDLSFVGYTAGNRWLYDVQVQNYLITYQLIDSVTETGTWDGSGGRCSFSFPVDKANFIMHEYMYASEPDYTFAYYDGTYLVDFVYAFHHSPFMGTGIRTLKFPLTVGETWQAIDTCIYALGQRIPHPDGSIDTDTLIDTLWYDTSYASLTSYEGDTLVVALSPIRIAEKTTEILPLDDTLLVCCAITLKELYGTIMYVRSSGIHRLNIDSVVFYQSVLLIDTAETPWDTTFVPPTYMHTMYDYFTWDLAPISVREKDVKGRTPFTFIGKVLRVYTIGYVYAYDGRRIAHLYPGEEVILKPGIYFVKTGKQVKRIVVR